MTRRRAPIRPTEPDFDLRIDEVVLEGFPPGQGRAIAAALEQELGRLLRNLPKGFAEAKPGSAGKVISVDRLEAATITCPPGASARIVGQSAAQAIVGRLRTLSTGHDPASGRRRAP